MHRRAGPGGREFRYRVWMLLLDVDDIDAALPLEARPWLSARRAALLMVRGEDHLPAGSHPKLENPPADLRGRVESVLRSELDE